jgi:hypothetical protein
VGEWSQHIFLAASGFGFFIYHDLILSYVKKLSTFSLTGILKALVSRCDGMRQGRMRLGVGGRIFRFG